MKDEISNILAFYKNGKISCDKAVSMIDSLYKTSKGKILYITISEDGKKEPTKITMPIKFVSLIMKTFGKIPDLNIKGLEELDSEEVSKLILMAIEKGVVGELVQLENDQNQIVKVSIV